MYLVHEVDLRKANAQLKFRGPDDNQTTSNLLEMFVTYTQENRNFKKDVLERQIGI